MPPKFQGAVGFFYNGGKMLFIRGDYFMLKVYDFLFQF